MVLIGRRLSADELQAVLDDAAVVDELLYGDLEDDDGEMPEPELDLDKSWHGVHYLLTGTAWDISQGAGEAVLGGEEIGEDGGYGPARLFTPEAVRAVAAALDALDLDALRARFDPRAMAALDIYPSPGAELAKFDDLAASLTDLHRFYKGAAADGQAVLLVIT
ncbi:DUF1877 family protein [Catellatospora paridis]|uniref:DUF1877 family protein n=1 Tax=Catellatospora paridis TaxID=1617086 RepID=UPI0012D4A160|nr:DUF1877 family protein [Catellatospora paridis]